nr:PREDICTED: peroxidase 4-like [Musa acuminata subsp. malaccensis]
MPSRHARVESLCRGTVSCADILGLATRESVALFGGPSWAVFLGRGGARTTSQASATANLPPPSASLSGLVSSFASKGLAPWDVISLSGAHTVGQARCTSCRPPHLRRQKRRQRRDRILETISRHGIRWSLEISISRPSDVHGII